MINVPKMFGSKVFNDEKMRERLPHETYKALRRTMTNGEPLDINVAKVVATAMKDWAVENGCTHYTHWFQPMTGITAEKHDSFITPVDDGKVIMEFSGKELIKGEPDASSFPNGGIRATFEARGYTAWDPTSYAFIKDTSLYIPTVFCSYTGEVLDKKTPLLRSIECINTEAVKILHLFGKTDVTRVNTTVGAEQEYFLVDENTYKKRKDLMYCGRTLFGAKSPKGQELDDHYFGTIKPRVAEFMKDLDEELWKFGIYSKTKHNEVAPGQHEMAPIFTATNLASDHNQLTMQLMKNIAKKHGLVCLLHEKPFESVNGSGKHNNWSLCTNTGENLLSPGKQPENNKQFLLFLSAVIKAVDEYQDLLRISVATAGNDHRLGANEAPPAILSMYIGDDLYSILESYEYGTDYHSQSKIKMRVGIDAIPEFKKDNTDRNRTSPLAFTGNKFEFRMLGSSLSIAGPNIVLNTIVAEELSKFYEILKYAQDFDKAVDNIIAKTFTEHKRILFNGNNYSEEWKIEAENRGLLNLRSTPEALPHYLAQKNIDLFKKHNIYTEAEMTARYEILLESYAKIVKIEGLTMLNMAKKEIIPAIVKYSDKVANSALTKKQLCSDIPVDTELNLVKDLSALLSEFNICVNKLEVELQNVANLNTNAQGVADYYVNTVIPSMNKVREISDAMETITSREYWPFPSYGELLFGVD